MLPNSLAAVEGIAKSLVDATKDTFSFIAPKPPQCALNSTSLLSAEVSSEMKNTSLAGSYPHGIMIKLKTITKIPANCLLYITPDNTLELCDDTFLNRSYRKLYGHDKKRITDYVFEFYLQLQRYVKEEAILTFHSIEKGLNLVKSEIKAQNDEKTRLEELNTIDILVAADIASADKPRSMSERSDISEESFELDQDNATIREIEKAVSNFTPPLDSMVPQAKRPTSQPTQQTFLTQQTPLTHQQQQTEPGSVLLSAGAPTARKKSISDRKTKSSSRQVDGGTSGALATGQKWGPSSTPIQAGLTPSINAAQQSSGTHQTQPVQRPKASAIDKNGAVEQMIEGALSQLKEKKTALELQYDESVGILRDICEECINSRAGLSNLNNYYIKYIGVTTTLDHIDRIILPSIIRSIKETISPQYYTEKIERFS